jgi:four helix bundle suffix protein
MSDLIPKHGGYRKLKSFQLSQLIYDVTVRFCERYIERSSRTRDQMTQAARSGVQNIAEGSQVSATSKKMELKLTQVARASLEELKLDYEDFLRQRKLTVLAPQDPILMRFKNLKCSTLEQVQAWVAQERKIATDNQGPTQPTDTSVGCASQCSSLSSSCLAANAALSLLNVATYLLDRQVERLAKDFEKDGGFTERLYKIRNAKRRKPPEPGSN